MKRTKRGKQAASSAAHQGWLRLDHEGLGMPLPAVYVPAADLYQPDLAALGFARLAEVMAGAVIPRTPNIVADAGSSPEQLTLVISRHDLFAEPGPKALTEDRDTKVVTGRYPTPAEPHWQSQVQEASWILLIAGPQPAPAGSTGARTPQAYLLSREVLSGLLFDPSTMVAGVNASASQVA